MEQNEDQERLERLQQIARQAWYVFDAWRQFGPASSDTARWQNGLFELVQGLPEDDFGWASDDQPTGESA